MEEFFAKKRIDLEQLKGSDALLFAELKAHFEQMGPKSFDHTKKYLFNKLRGSFPLRKESLKEAAPVTTILTTPIDRTTPAEELSTSSAETSPSEDHPAAASKPAGFKPRFKAAKAADTANEEPIDPS